MARKPASPAKVRGPGMVFARRFGPGLFQAHDISELATAAGMPPPATDHAELAAGLDRAFIWAHAVAWMGRNTPPSGELRDAYARAAKAGREFLLALGLDDQPAMLIGRTLREITEQSGVLQALVRWAAKTPEERRLIPSAALGVAFLVAKAEAAAAETARSSPPGPRAEAFAPTLLEDLARLYRQSFGQWPAIERDVDGLCSGAGFLWLHRVLLMASDRIPLCRFERGDELLREVKTLVFDNEPTTRAAKFEKAIAAAKRREPGLREVTA